MRVPGSAGRRLAFACAAVLLAVAAPHAHAADAHARLARLTRSVAEHAARWPFEEPSLPGAIRRGPDIVPVSAAVIDSDRAFRVQATAELEGIRLALIRSTPDAKTSTDIGVLQGWLDWARFTRDGIRLYEMDPGAPWPRIDAALRPLVVGRGTPLCHRLGIATRQLRAIPEALRAEQTVFVPSRSTRDRVSLTIAAYERTLALLRRDFPAGVKECRDPGSVGAFAEADSNAASAIEAHIEWLRTDVMPRVPDTPGLIRTIAAIPADSDRVVTADSLLRVSARMRGANNVRATLGTRAVALAWADDLFKSRGALAPPDTLWDKVRARQDEAVESLHAHVAARLGPRFSYRAFLDALLAEGPVPARAVRDAVLRRLGVH